MSRNTPVASNSLTVRLRLANKPGMLGRITSAIGEAGDTFTDFTTTAGANEDTLDVRTMWATFTGTAGITTVAQAVTGGHLTFTQSGSHTQVYADANGGAHNAGEQILLATLQNTTASAVQAHTLLL